MFANRITSWQESPYPGKRQLERRKIENRLQDRSSVQLRPGAQTNTSVLELAKVMPNGLENAWKAIRSEESIRSGIAEELETTGESEASSEDNSQGSSRSAIEADGTCREVG